MAVADAGRIDSGEGVSLLAYSPLAFGQLTAKYLDDPKAQGRLTVFPENWSPRYVRPEVLAATAEYAALARENGLTPAQMALLVEAMDWRRTIAPPPPPRATSSTPKRCFA